MKAKWIPLLAGLLLLFSGCASDTTNVSPVTLTERLIQEVEIPLGQLITHENAAEYSDMIKATLGEAFQADKLKAFAYYPPLMNVSANEYGIFQLKDKKDAEELSDLLEKRISDVQGQFERYLPEQYGIAKAGEVRRHQNYVYYSMTAENDKVFTIIEEVLKA